MQLVTRFISFMFPIVPAELLMFLLTVLGSAWWSGFCGGKDEFGMVSPDQQKTGIKPGFYLGDFFYNFFKDVRVIYCQLCQDFAIQLNVFFFQAVDELTIGSTIFARRRIYTSCP